MIGRNIPHFGLTKESDWTSTASAVGLFFYRLSVSIDSAFHYRKTGELITDQGVNHIVCDELGLNIDQFEELFAKGANIVEHDEDLAEFYEDFTRRCGQMLSTLGFTVEEIDQIADHVDEVDNTVDLLNELWNLPEADS